MISSLTVVLVRERRRKAHNPRQRHPWWDCQLHNPQRHRHKRKLCIHTRRPDRFARGGSRTSEAGKDHQKWKRDLDPIRRCVPSFNNSQHRNSCDVWGPARKVGKGHGHVYRPSCHEACRKGRQIQEVMLVQRTLRCVCYKNHYWGGIVGRSSDIL